MIRIEQGRLHVRPPAGLTIMAMRELIGTSSDPRFYNQDWYFDQDFANTPTDHKWHILSPTVDARHRGKVFNSIPQDELPDAITVVYAFFAYRFLVGANLWPHDYTWCRDYDWKGDPIYVGGYALNRKEGLEIHRHLSLGEHHSVVTEYRGAEDDKVPIL